MAAEPCSEHEFWLLAARYWQARIAHAEQHALPLDKLRDNLRECLAETGVQPTSVVRHPLA